jgi:hypothetical protein
MRFVRFVSPCSLALSSALALLLTCAQSAQAQTITFEGAPAGNYISYTESGVTFTAVGGGNLTSTTFFNTPNGTKGIIGANLVTLQEIRADIAGGATFVSVDLGDFGAGADSDTIFLQAFDAANNPSGYHIAADSEYV